MPTLSPIKTIVSITPRAVSQIARGSQWIFSNEIVGRLKEFEPGTWCDFESQGQFVGTGYVNPHSLIAGRVVSRGKESSVSDLLQRRLHEAFQRRRTLKSRGSCRLVFSEADFVPGLILDWYSGVAVLQSNTAGIDQVMDLLEQLVPKIFKDVFQEELTGFVLRGDSSIRTLEGVENFARVVRGTESELRQGSFQEDGLTFCADFMEGQKTGFFLDQRDNRQHFEELVKTKSHATVLDLFCYSGGWGFRALRGGAKQVTFVDQSKDALQFVRDGLLKNKFDPERTRVVEADVFDYLESTNEQFDVVIADPPAFVKSKKVLPQAKKAYEKLNRLAWGKLSPGGLLLTSSCSYHLSESDFMDVLSLALSRDECRAHVVYRGMQALDHPVLLAMPETRYLKSVVLQKIK